jgi:hypothetical protein
MQDRSRKAEPAALSVAPCSGPLFGLDAVNGGGRSDAKTSPRLALWISRRWAVTAPRLRLSLSDISTLPTIREEFSRLLTGLLRGGVNTRRIARMPLLEVMLLSKENREAWMRDILNEQKGTTSAKSKG